MAITLADLRTKCYNILREEENNSAYPYALVDDLINDAVWAICSWLYVNPLTKEEIHKGQLPFLNKEVFYETSLVQYVTSDVNAGATEIEINTGTRPNEWVCYIWGNIVEYREKDETHLYQCTWVNGKIKAGEQASIVYKVPSDFMSPINVILDDRVQIDNKNYDDVFESLRDNKGLPEYKYRMQQWRGFDKPFYVIKDGKYVVTYNINTSWMMLRLRYECKPNILIQPIDEVIIPDDVYAITTVPYLAVGETMYNRWEEQRGAEVINWWNGKLKEMYKFYNKMWVERNTSQQYKMAKSKFNI